MLFSTTETAACVVFLVSSLLLSTTATTVLVCESQGEKEGPTNVTMSSRKDTVTCIKRVSGKTQGQQLSKLVNKRLELYCSYFK